MQRQCLETISNCSNHSGICQFAGGGDWIRTSVGVSQQIYSLPPLATRAPLQKQVLDYAIFSKVFAIFNIIFSPNDGFLPRLHKIFVGQREVITTQKGDRWPLG